MPYDSYNPDWITVYCPVCSTSLGEKRKGELESFECPSEGCSKTRHYFYPGEIKRPGKSVPWHSYHEKRNKCGKPCCDPEDIEEDNP